MPELTPELQSKAVEFATKVGGAILLLIIVWIVAAWARRATAAWCKRAEFDLTLSKFFSGIVRWLILIAGILAILGMFGIQTTSFAAILGGAGLAVGMALSGTLGNFAAGVLLLVFRPFKVGDVVSAAGVTGKVDAIELFVTTLDTPDNRRLIVPNGAVFGGTIENISFHDTRRVDVVVGTDYSADLERTRDVLARAARSVGPRLEDRDPDVVLTGLGASSIDWSVRVWVDAGNFWPVKDALTEALKVALDEAGIGIPFPQMDVHLDPAATEPVSGAA